MLRNERHSRGDTLIEVLLAITVMATVITLTLRTMNLGFANVLNATQRTEVQSLINGQVAMLRAAHDQAGDDWDLIDSYAGGSAASIEADGCTYFSSAGGVKQFYFDNTQTGLGINWETPVILTGHSLPISNSPIPKAGDGIWVEGKKFTVTGGAKDYYDFYVKACWQSSGEGPPAQLKTVVRLYDQ